MKQYQQIAAHLTKTFMLRGAASALIGAAAISAAFAATSSDVIASAGKATVTQAEIQALIKAASPDVRARLAANPAMLDQLIRNRLAETQVYDEALDKGWDKRPEVQAQLTQAAHATLIHSYLESVSAPPADYPSDADLQAAYEQNKASFNAPRSYRLSQIYLLTPSGGDAASVDKVQKQAADLARQARAPGADFAALARSQSQDRPTAAQGGDMGYIAENQMLPEVRKAVETLKPGAVSDPVRTVGGWHIVKLVDMRAAGVLPLASVKEQLRTTLRQQRQQQALQAYLQKLQTQNAASINADALNKVVAGTAVQ